MIQERKTIAKIIPHQGSSAQFSSLQFMDKFQGTKLFNEKCDYLQSRGHQIYEWKACNLYLGFTNSNGIIKAIKDIVFMDLITLWIQSTNIANIEGLSRLKAPNIKYFNLMKNKIVSVLPIRKMCSFQMQTMNITNNYIIDYQCLNQVKWKKLLIINLQLVPQSPVFQNIGFYIKTQIQESEQKQYLYINSADHIIQKNVMESLVRKHGNILYIKIANCYFNK